MAASNFFLDKLRRIMLGLGALLGSILLTTGCGGGGGGGTTTHAIGGSVSGLLGTIVIQNNSADTLSLAANGTFSFTTPIAQGSVYAVTVLTQPAGQICTVANASGAAGGPVTNISITCTAVRTIGGTVTGLLGTLVIQNNGADSLSLSVDGLFVFSTAIAHGSAYAATIMAQPSGQICIAANSSGTVSAAVTNIAITCTAAQVLALFAGEMGGRGNADGTGAAARFDGPGGITTDSAGNVYVADASNHTIRKITPAGAVSTFAGSAGLIGSADGAGSSARFYGPFGVASDSLDSIYVADAFNFTIRKISPAGTVSTLAGSVGQSGSADGRGSAARFGTPIGVATDSGGNVYVADEFNHTIRKITPTGAVSTLAGSAGLIGSTDGPGPSARFNGPWGLATDSAGNVYVADLFDHTIRKITSNGVVTTFAGAAGAAGSADGTGTLARFNNPARVATDSAGNVYVADGRNYTIRKITPGGGVSTVAGAIGLRGNVDGIGDVARFDGPAGVTADSAGNVYVADAGNQSIRRITPEGAVSTLAGAGVRIGSADGGGGAARFKGPIGVATDIAGNVYVADRDNHTIRKITPAGAANTFAGSAGLDGTADGSGAAARFRLPEGIATDRAGNVYVADIFNHTIRKITPLGAVSTLAGSAGSIGSADGSGAAARFYDPRSVAADSSGNVYVADRANHTIRKVSPAGAVTTFAGSAGASGSADGTGASARFNSPIGVTTDDANNVYVADNVNRTIRKITPAGEVSTLAGAAGIPGSVDGVGAAARFGLPTGVATDGAGNVYVADNSNHTIRKITPAGVVSTIVGVTGLATFVPGALPGVLSFPMAVALSGRSLYVTMANGVVVVRQVP